MENAGFVIGSYVVTLLAVGGYVWRILASGRRIAKELPDEDRPWT